MRNHFFSIFNLAIILSIFLLNVTADCIAICNCCIKSPILGNSYGALSLLSLFAFESRFVLHNRLHVCTRLSCQRSTLALNCLMTCIPITPLYFPSSVTLVCLFLLNYPETTVSRYTANILLTMFLANLSNI